MNFRDRVLSGRGMTMADTVNDNLVAPIVKSDCFGIESIRNLPACIDFRFESGDRYALPYSLITGINYDKSEGIEIITPPNKMLIKGYNLTQLYDYLVLYRVKYIQYSEYKVKNSKNTCIVSIQV